MAERWVRASPCRDGVGRTRGLQVVVTDDNAIGLVSPPGEIAILQPREVRNLQQLLTSAVIEATHRIAEEPGESHIGECAKERHV